LAAVDNVIGLDTTGVGSVGEIELHEQFDAARATEAAYQIGMLCAQAGDHAPGRPQHHGPTGKRHLRVEGNQPSQLGDSQQTATGLQVGLPIHKHLASPEASCGRLVVVTQLDRQRCVAILQRLLDACQAAFNIDSGRPRTHPSTIPRRRSSSASFRYPKETPCLQATDDG
jgi:hypothetical protein